jgi:hypothetical protein
MLPFGLPVYHAFVDEGRRGETCADAPSASRPAPTAVLNDCKTGRPLWITMIVRTSAASEERGLARPSRVLEAFDPALATPHGHNADRISQPAKSDGILPGKCLRGLRQRELRTSTRGISGGPVFGCLRAEDASGALCCLPARHTFRLSSATANGLRDRSCTRLDTQEGGDPCTPFGGTSTQPSKTQ